MNLDKASIYQKLDQSRVADSITFLPRQLHQVLDDAPAITIPKSYSRINNILVNGMGGSNLGARILRSIMKESLPIPFDIEPGYQIPGYVGPDTLYVLSSYSGNTEEPLSVYPEVKKRKAKILAICSSRDNRLKRLMEKEKIPGYIFDPRENPCGEPRLGVGYSILGIIMLLSRSGIFKISATEIEKIIIQLERSDLGLRINVPIEKNIAKKSAIQLYKHIPVLIGAEHLEGNLHALRNQYCESAKNFCEYLTVPDLNHFALEGLSYPAANAKNLIFFFFLSSLYHPRVQKRIALTEKAVSKNGIATIKYKLKGTARLAQAFELLQFGSWLTFYAGIANGIDPVNTPWVAWFKKELG